MLKKDLAATAAVFALAESVVVIFDWPSTVAAVASAAFGIGVGFARLYVAAVGPENTRVDEALDQAADGLVKWADTVRSKKQ